MIMKNGLLFLLFSIIAAQVSAQRIGTVKGVLTDSLSKQSIPGATLTLMQRKDSSLVSFTMTDASGRFELRNLPVGDFRLLVTHVNYYNRSLYFSVNQEQKDKDFGNVVLYDKSKILEEVVVTAEAPPVTMIADTIQYNAGSFRVQPNASVEDLLKKLPGVKVEKDGTVKAQGEKVNRVLVDGKEFFGNDPKIATRNLPADAIDKVQVYDRMSAQSQLTGFDDGNSEKTINLKLKKDKKKGLFGKAMAGGGTNERYEGRFNINSFKGARQFSVIGMGNNNNAEGFSFMDMLNFTGELNRLRQGGSGGNINITLGGDEDNTAFAGMGGSSTGINTAWGTGVNYNNIIGKKTDFQSNYFYNYFNPYTDTRLNRQYFLADSTYYYNQHAQTDNAAHSQRLNLNADIVIDSFHSLRLSPSIGHQRSENSVFSEYENLSDQKARTVDGFSQNLTKSEGINFRNDLLFRKKFRRKGRTFSLSLQNSYNSSEGTGSFVSVNNFYSPLNGSVLRRDSLDQRNAAKGDLNGYTARMVYTEPLGKRSLLEFSVANSATRSFSSRETFDLNKLNGIYNQLNPLLTNDFRNRYGYWQGGIRYRMQRRKFSLAAGGSWQKAELEGKIRAANKDSVIRKTFINFLPNARFQYSFTKYRTLSLNYNTQTNQPTVQQLQPVPDISNPLNIRLGNPDLKQEFSHLIRAQFTSINPFRNRNLFVFFNLMKTDNKIVNDDVVANGIKTSRPVNVNGIYNFTGEVSVGIPVQALKGNLNISSSLGYFRNKQIVNSVMNTSHTFMAGPDLRLDMGLTDKLSWSVSAGINYNQTQYSLPSAVDVNYFSHRYSTEIDWQLPKNFFLSTDFTYTVNDQLSQGFNARVPFWNASISKQFLRFNRGELRLRAFDLLKQNLGVSRTSNQNYIEDLRQVNLQRFFLLSFTYSLNKNGLGQGGSASGMRIITR